MLRKILEHKTNPLHVYCRLISLGLNKKSAMLIAKLYDKLIYWIMKGENYGNHTKNHRKT